MFVIVRLVKSPNSYFLSEMFRKEGKVNLLHDFSPRSQFSCTRCIKYRHVKRIDELLIGSHVCFEVKFKFYHAIISKISKVNEKRVRLCIIHASKKSELAVVKRLFGKEFAQHDIIYEEYLPELDLTKSSIYIVQYDRCVCKNEMVLKRAMSQIHRSGNRVQRSSASIAYERFQSEPENIDETSERFASWCVTGECVSLNTRSSRDCIEYIKSPADITMHLRVISDKDPIESATKLHQQRLLCDTCFLTEVVRLVNSQDTPETKYFLHKLNAAWVQDRQTPNGLYRVKYKPQIEEVLIKIKRYNAKTKRRASQIEKETFVFTLVPGRKCQVTDTEILYTCFCPL